MRSVSQGDVIRADAKEIPRIFQVCITKTSSFVINLLSFFHSCCMPVKARAVNQVKVSLNHRQTKMSVYSRYTLRFSFHLLSSFFL